MLHLWAFVYVFICLRYNSLASMRCLKTISRLYCSSLYWHVNSQTTSIFCFWTGKVSRLKHDWMSYSWYHFAFCQHPVDRDAEAVNFSCSLCISSVGLCGGGGCHHHHSPQQSNNLTDKNNSTWRLRTGNTNLEPFFGKHVFLKTW